MTTCKQTAIISHTCAHLLLAPATRRSSSQALATSLLFQTVVLYQFYHPQHTAHMLDIYQQNNGTKTPRSKSQQRHVRQMLSKR